MIMDEKTRDKLFREIYTTCCNIAAKQDEAGIRGQGGEGGGTPPHGQEMK
jgi:hypothetical protein